MSSGNCKSSFATSSLAFAATGLDWELSTASVNLLASSEFSISDSKIFSSGASAIRSFAKEANSGSDLPNSVKTVSSSGRGRKPQSARKLVRAIRASGL